jgi:hypothetical protein
VVSIESVATEQPADPPVDLEALDRQLADLRQRQRAAAEHRPLWLAHHWPEHHAERCVRIGSLPVCRRCLALHPLGLTVALVAAAGHPPWPARFDPWPVWLLSIPATTAYVGEALGWFPYRARWQTVTTLLAAVAFGRALGYELLDRWQPVFWGPIAVFGGIWFLATVAGLKRRAQRAATASSSSSSVL